MSNPKFNKYRAAIELLQRGRDTLMDELAETLLDQGEDLLSGGFLFNELIESHGTRLHFLCLLLSQMEQSAEVFDEAQAAEALGATESELWPDEVEVEVEFEEEDEDEDEIVEEEPEVSPPPKARKRRSNPRSSVSSSSSSPSASTRPRSGKKLSRQSSPEGSPDDA